MRVVQEAWRGLWMCEVQSQGVGNGLGRGADEADKENVGDGRVMKRLGAFGRVRRVASGDGSRAGGPLQMLARGEVVVRPFEHERDEEGDLSRVEMGAEEGRTQHAIEAEADAKQYEVKGADTVGEKSKSRDKIKDKKSKKKKGRRLTPLMDEYDVKSPSYTNEELRRSWNSIR